MHASAPVADVLGVVLEELDVVDANGAPGTSEAPADRLLNVQEAAALLDVRPRWLYDHAKTLPFAREAGRAYAALLRGRDAALARAAGGVSNKGLVAGIVFDRPQGGDIT